MDGDDPRGRPYNSRSNVGQKETLLLEVDDQYGKRLTSDPGTFRVDERVKKLEGGVEPPGMPKEPETRSAPLDPSGRFLDEHSYSTGFGGAPLPDNLSVVKQQIISVTDVKTNRSYEVGRFEYKWTKGTLTVTDYTRGAAAAKSVTYKR